MSSIGRFSACRIATSRAAISTLPAPTATMPSAPVSRMSRAAACTTSTFACRPARSKTAAIDAPASDCSLAISPEFRATEWPQNTSARRTFSRRSSAGRFASASAPPKMRSRWASALKFVSLT